MIDWLTVVVPGVDTRILRPGMVLSVDPEGVVEWQTLKWLQAQGSYSQHIALRPVSEGLCVSGCPAKFLQGHNIFGSDDLPGIAKEVTLRVIETVGIPRPIRTDWGSCRLNRVDINYSYRCGTRSDVLAWLHAAEKHGNLEHRGRGIFQGNTLVFGKGSRYWSIKAYAKGPELEVPKHRLPTELPKRDKLHDFADPLLRVELQLRGKQLRRIGLGTVGDWRGASPSQIFADHLAKLSVTGEFRISEAEMNHLSPTLRMTYTAWRSGSDVRQILPRRTFYRHRSALLEHGIDIAVEAPDARSNVVPLLRVIEAVPVDPPEWARGTALLYGA